MPMQMTATLRISTVALVLGALVLSGARAAEPPPINILSANLKRGLIKSDIDQVKAHTTYWVAQLAGAKTSGDVYTAREGVLADYSKYASSIPYQVEFARYTAAIVPGAMGKLNKDGRLFSLKEINFAIVISKLTQLTAIGAMDALVRHENPGVRFLAWSGLREVRNQAIQKGGQAAKLLFAALDRHAASESSPLVAAVIAETLNIDKSALTAGAFKNAFKKAFDRNFSTLVGMLKTSCNRLAGGDASWARPCIAALPILQTAADFYKPDTKKATLILQQLINIAQAAAKAFAASDGVGTGAFQCTPLLLQVELVIGSLSDDSGTDIRKPLLNRKMSPEEKSKAIPRGVLEWIARLEELGIKEPVFTPVKPPATTSQPTTKPAATPAGPIKAAK